MMNDQSYYALLFVDILKKDILNLHELLFERLIEQLHHDHVDFPVKGTPELMDALKPRFLPTNNNRKVLGTINEYVYTTELHLYHNYQGLIQLINLPELNGRLNDNLVGALKAKKLEYGRPIEEMKIIINQVCG